MSLGALPMGSSNEAMQAFERWSLSVLRGGGVEVELIVTWRRVSSGRQRSRPCGCPTPPTVPGISLNDLGAFELFMFQSFVEK